MSTPYQTSRVGLRHGNGLFWSFLCSPQVPTWWPPPQGKDKMSLRNMMNTSKQRLGRQSTVFSYIILKSTPFNKGFWGQTKQNKAWEATATTLKCFVSIPASSIYLAYAMNTWWKIWKNVLYNTATTLVPSLKLNSEHQLALAPFQHDGLKSFGHPSAPPRQNCGRKQPSLESNMSRWKRNSWKMSENHIEDAVFVLLNSFIHDLSWSVNLRRYDMHNQKQ